MGVPLKRWGTIDIFNFLNYTFLEGRAMTIKPKINPISLVKSTFLNEKETKLRLAEFIVNSNRLSMGEQCENFEFAFSKFQECSFTTLCNSGSSANLLLIQSLINLGRLNKNDKVAFSALTWSTNVMPLIQLGLKSVPVDINSGTLNVSSKTFKQTITDHPDIKAFFISNILGFCDDLDIIANICNDNKIILIEDNCESFGSVYKGKKLGNFGIASTCSSFVGHHLSTIEGGMISTNDAELDSMLKMVRAHGWDRSLPVKEQMELRKKNNVESFYDLYTFYDLGYNLRPTEITGFLGLIQMEVAEKIIYQRQKNYLNLDEAVSNNSRILPVRGAHMDVVSNFAYPIVCKTLDDFHYYLQKSMAIGIEIRPIVGGNMTNQPFYRKYDVSDWSLPVVDFVHNHGFYLPNNPELSEDEVATLAELITD